MATYPKRVWTWKKLVYSDKKPVWELDWKVWVYNPNFTEVSEWETYTDRWNSMEASDELVTYDGLTKSKSIWTFKDESEAKKDKTDTTSSEENAADPVDLLNKALNSEIE